VVLDCLQVELGSRPACDFGAICSHAELSANSFERTAIRQYVVFEVIMAVYNVYCYV
jgi:hypothetical protein